MARHYCLQFTFSFTPSVSLSFQQVSDCEHPAPEASFLQLSSQKKRSQQKDSSSQSDSRLSPGWLTNLPSNSSKPQLSESLKYLEYCLLHLNATQQ